MKIVEKDVEELLKTLKQEKEVLDKNIRYVELYLKMVKEGTL